MAEDKITEPPISVLSVVDEDGDEWVRCPDGWCCRGMCEHDGQQVQHDCSEHDHLEWPRVAIFSPTWADPKEAS
jgi:hypothetical protein